MLLLTLAVARRSRPDGRVPYDGYIPKGTSRLGETMDAQESVTLAAGALAGDRIALTRLVAVLTPVIKARVARTLYARRWGPGGGRNVYEEVEDLSQDVFLALFVEDGRVLRRWQVERGLSLENFVGLVAERYTLSYLRSGRRNHRLEEPTEDDDFDRRDDEPDLLRILVGKEELDLLLDCLRERLTPLGWHMFTLLFVQMLSAEEAMAATGLSRAAVDAWRSRLRRLARKLMGELSEINRRPRNPGKDD